MKNNINNILLIAILIIVVGVGGFFAGMKYQESKRPTLDKQFAGQQGTMRNGQGQTQGNRQGFRPVNGEIISSDDKSITVKLQDGSSKIILIVDKTTINKATETTKDDLKNGEKVMVIGQENSDGSVTAQSISLGGGMLQGMPRGNQPGQNNQ